MAGRLRDFCLTQMYTVTVSVAMEFATRRSKQQCCKHGYNRAPPPFPPSLSLSRQVCVCVCVCVCDVLVNIMWILSCVCVAVELHT